MVDLLKAGLMEMRWNGRMALLGLHFFGRRSELILLLVVVLTFAGEIIRSFVFVGRPELES